MSNIDKTKNPKTAYYPDHRAGVMDNNDEINLELSRTYFRSNTERREQEERRANKDRRNIPDRRDASPEVKKSIQFKPIFIFSAVLAVIFLFTGYVLLSRVTDPSKASPLSADQSGQTQKTRPDPLVPALIPKNGACVLSDFETGDDGWEIPAWARNLRDHVAETVEHSDAYSSIGGKSLKINASFHDKEWSAALVEIQQFFNFQNFDIIAADVFFPGDGTAKTLRGTLILTEGKDWEFNEMSRSLRIEPGKWTTIWADFSENSLDWKDRKLGPFFKNDIRKIAIRIESTKTPYSGPIFVDNIRVSTKERFLGQKS